MRKKQLSPWFVTFRQHYAIGNIVTKIQLYCFHHAGGSANSFKEWSKLLPSEIEVIAVQLPGREMRFSEPFITNVSVIAQQLLHEFDHLNKPFAFFGHSTGAIIAYEVAATLQNNKLPLPKLLITSGKNGPSYPRLTPIIHNLPDDIFIEEIRKYNGMPDEILNNPDLLNLILPRLKADFAISGTYTHKQTNPLNCPIYAFGADNDNSTSYEGLNEWQRHTNKRFISYILPGKHFFINDQDSGFLKTINFILKTQCKLGNISS